MKIQYILKKQKLQNEAELLFNKKNNYYFYSPEDI